MPTKLNVLVMPELRRTGCVQVRLLQSTDPVFCAVRCFSYPWLAHSMRMDRKNSECENIGETTRPRSPFFECVLARRLISRVEHTGVQVLLAEKARQLHIPKAVPVSAR